MEDVCERRRGCPVTKDGGYAPLESQDGKYLYYIKALVSTDFVPSRDARAIQFPSFARDNISSIAKFEKGLVSDPAVSPNSDWILSTMEQESGSESLLSITNFAGSPPQRQD